MTSSRHKLLIANRGEIALRIIRSAVDLGVPTLSIYTDADSSAPHVFRATESVLVPSYIDQEHLIDMCKERNVTMVHPGYGFLSENEVSLRAAESTPCSTPLSSPVAESPTHPLSPGLCSQSSRCRHHLARTDPRTDQEHGSQARSACARSRRRRPCPPGQ